jgi:protein-tyrosine phosphatase
MREVIPTVLWIGNAQDGHNVQAVLGLGISAVVNLAMEEPPTLYPRDVVYCRFPLIDGAGNATAVLKSAIDTIANLIRGPIPTLVTCDGGMSRSPAIVAAALAAIENTSPEKALARIAAAGPHDVSATFWADVQQAVER